MLQLLSSFWFIALAALLVPVLIHFWNKKQPKVIKVGSIKWLAAAASKKARSLRFQDWPLLLLRCLLLAALVVYLVQPIWKQKLPAQHKKYAWIAPELLQAPQLSLIQNTLDSLVNQEYELRQLNNDFTLLTPKDWEIIKNNPVLIKNPGVAANYWLLVKSLNQKFSTAAEHLIFTSNRLAYFSGSRPQLTPNIKWVTVPLNKQKVWVQEAFLASSDSLTILLGRSNGSGATLEQYTFATPAINQTLNIAGAPELLYTREDKQAFISVPDSQEKVLIKADSLQIAIFYDQSRKADANYVQAALTALRTYSQRPVSIKFTNNIQEIGANLNLLFWLSDADIPAKMSQEIAQGLFIFKDAPSEVKSMSGNWLKIAGLPEAIELSKQASVSRENSLQIWQNNYGESVLQLIPKGKGGTYHFASRFNSQWNGLPESSFFPEILSALLWQEPVIKQDARQIAESQIQPDLINATAVNSNVNFQVLNLKYWFLLLATLLFLVERVWVYHKAKIST